MSDKRRERRDPDAVLAAVAAEMDPHERDLFGFFGEPFRGERPQTADDDPAWQAAHATTVELEEPVNAVIVPEKRVGRQRTFRRIRRWGAAVMTLAVAGSLVGIVAAHIPNQPPLAYKKLPPAVVSAALASDALLLATGTCADELNAQADIEQAFLGPNHGAVDQKYWNRPDLFRAAAARAMAEDIPCSPPDSNPKGGYELPAGSGYDSQVLYGYDVVDVELGDAGWCTERLVISIVEPPAGLDRAYEHAQITVGDQVAAAHGIVSTILYRRKLQPAK